MNKIFCMQCGNKHEYTDRPPRFCSECSNPFNSSSTATTNKTTPKPTVIVNQIDDDNDNDDDTGAEVPKIDKLDIEIDIRQKKETIGNLVGTSKSGQGQEFLRPPPKKMSKKKVLEQFRREAGTIRDRLKESKEVN